MKFSEALEKAEDGHKLRASGWNENSYMYFELGRLMLHTYDGFEIDFTVTTADISAEYQIVEDSKKDEVIELEQVVSDDGCVVYVDKELMMLVGDGSFEDWDCAGEIILIGIKRKYNKTKKCFV